MVHYEWFGPQGQRRSDEMSDEHAERSIGARVMIGFDVVQRSWSDENGDHVWVVYCQSDFDGRVWAVYF